MTDKPGRHHGSTPTMQFAEGFNDTGGETAVDSQPAPLDDEPIESPHRHLIAQRQATHRRSEPTATHPAPAAHLQPAPVRTLDARPQLAEDRRLRDARREVLDLAPPRVGPAFVQKPRWAGHLISTEPSVRNPAASRSPAEPPEVTVDGATGLQVVSCSGLTLVAVPQLSQVKTALDLLRTFVRGPRDKGILVLAASAEFALAPQDGRGLAARGISVRQLQHDDVLSGALLLAREYQDGVAASLAHLHRFMGRRVTAS